MTVNIYLNTVLLQTVKPVSADHLAERMDVPAGITSGIEELQRSAHMPSDGLAYEAGLVRNTALACATPYSSVGKAECDPICTVVTDLIRLCEIFDIAFCAQPRLCNKPMVKVVPYL